MNGESEGYDVSIEGKIHPWSKGTISVAEIRELGGFPAGSQVVAVDLADNSETALPEDAVHPVVKREEGKPLIKKMGFSVQGQDGEQLLYRSSFIADGKEWLTARLFC